MTSSTNSFFTRSDLLAQLEKATGPDGTVGQIGKIVVNWVSILLLPLYYYEMHIIVKLCKSVKINSFFLPQLPRLNAYRAYCSNQLAAKALLDQKKQDPRVQDFLQRCLESPFSRKLDLWSFLDIPRSRLVKYPLLLKEILRHTPPDHPDTASLEQAVSTNTHPSPCRLSKLSRSGEIWC